MKRVIIAASLAALAAPAQAQQSPAVSPSEQALGQKLLQEIQAGLTCSAGSISIKNDLDRALARIKELEPKPAGPGVN